MKVNIVYGADPSDLANPDNIKVDDVEMPAVPRIGDEVSLSDIDHRLVEMVVWAAQQTPDGMARVFDAVSVHLSDTNTMDTHR